HVCLQNVINISKILINSDIHESVQFLNRFEIASYQFSRLNSTENGSLVSKIEDESFDWKAIRTIEHLKKNSE
ncbi:hypothetical protein S83_023126, partial [Arachis hypogaea]